MRKLHVIGWMLALCGAGTGLSGLAGCASSSYTAGDSCQGDSVSTVAADPMGAAIFGGSGHQSGSPDVATLDSK